MFLAVGMGGSLWHCTADEVADGSLNWTVFVVFLGPLGGECCREGSVLWQSD